MNSIVKFRWINLLGAVSFSIYGLLIGALPVFILNGFIVLVDLFYLRRIYFKEELFDVVEVTADSEYLEKFLSFHKKQILEYFPKFNFELPEKGLVFFVLRNTAVAGIFIGRKSDKELEVKLDYVLPEYRDYKNGKYIYHRLKQRFVNAGFDRITAQSGTKKHEKYLLKMGFENLHESGFEKKMTN
jgi:D-lyxose ketol-isomerase